MGLTNEMERSVPRETEKDRRWEGRIREEDNQRTR